MISKKFRRTLDEINPTRQALISLHTDSSEHADVAQEDEGDESAQKEFQKGGLDGNAQEEEDNMVITALRALSKAMISKKFRKTIESDEIKPAQQALHTDSSEHADVAQEDEGDESAQKEFQKGGLDLSKAKKKLPDRVVTQP